LEIDDKGLEPAMSKIINNFNLNKNEIKYLEE